MGYLPEFQTQINRRNFPKFLQLWEEYCTSDPVDVEELNQLLKMIKGSELSKPFGQIIETALPMWERISDEKDSYEVMRHLIDLEETHSSRLYDITLALLKKKYSEDPHFNERLRLVNMRTRENFQGALSNYDLLAHMNKGRFVYHAGGWGTGEIVDLSSLREQISVEFEHVAGRKHLTFTNAFKVLVPLPSEHFLARRFGDADRLEKEAKDDPVAIIKLLLQDLGPKTSSEIKDELCELVIPEKDWAKWWQLTRSKLKKDTLIESPEETKGVFVLRKAEVQHEERLLKALNAQKNPNEIIATTYAFLRDFPSIMKDAKAKESLREKFSALTQDSSLNEGQMLQVHIFLEEYLGQQDTEKSIEKIIQRDVDFKSIVDEIETLALKKRLLVLVRAHRKDWMDIFISVLFSNQPGSLREYLCKELNQEETQALLKKRLDTLLKAPQQNPEMFVWYFQMLLGKEKNQLPYGDEEGFFKWFEGLLILFHKLEFQPEYRELAKKIYMLLSAKRYALVRMVLEHSSLAYAEEFLLLSAKCQTFSDSEQKILRSLAAVVHPSLAKDGGHKKNPHHDSQTIWTTEEAYRDAQERIRHIGTTEIVANAREIEAARALGDLRENSEYKFALEKRSRLQGELKHLSEQLGHARIITKVDVNVDEVSIGSVVDVIDSKQQTQSFTILGPWDADPDKNILSLQSKLAQTMLGCKVDDKFSFRDEEYLVIGLRTIYSERDS